MNQYPKTVLAIAVILALIAGAAYGANMPVIKQAARALPKSNVL